MICPFCSSTQLRVVNSRPTKGDLQIWRRRKCLDCEEIFTTYERMNLSHLKVIKKSGKVQKYSRSKLFSGIYHSSIDRKNFDRGDNSVFAEELTNLVEREILSLKKKKIESKIITDIVLKLLRKKSPDTFLRFVAYREGDDPKRMNELLKKYY